MASSDVFETVHESFNKDTTHSLARKAVDAVLDLHHEYKEHCFHCSRGVNTPNWPRGAVRFPCPTVVAVLKTLEEN